MTDVQYTIALTFFGLMICLCLYAFGGCCIKRLKRFRIAAQGQSNQSTINHLRNLASQGRLIEQACLGFGQAMIRLSGLAFKERFDRCSHLLNSIERPFLMHDATPVLNANQLAARDLGRQYLLVIGLFLIIFAAAFLQQVGKSGLLLHSKDLISNLLCLSFFFLALLFLLPRLSALRMSSKIDSVRHSLTVRLPSLIDLWVIGLESGQAPSVALLGALHQNSHPAFAVLRYRLRRDIEGGLSLVESITKLGNALSIPSFCSLSQLIGIAVTQGGPIAERLKQFAEQSRHDTFLAAENDAMKAPLRLLAPLVTLIFPSTFIVLLFPVFYQLNMEFSR
ncbi:MAG: hypothetical protein EBV84_09050 [Betaproteobacteria bacterium]|nr:hypothetical protein [Betaproteobacteria bacterium]